MSGHLHPDELNEFEQHQVKLCYPGICRYCAEAVHRRMADEKLAQLRAENEGLRKALRLANHNCLHSPGCPSEGLYLHMVGPSGCDCAARDVRAALTPSPTPEPAPPKEHNCEWARLGRAATDAVIACRKSGFDGESVDAQSDAIEALLELRRGEHRSSPPEPTPQPPIRCPVCDGSGRDRMDCRHFEERER